MSKLPVTKQSAFEEAERQNHGQEPGDREAGLSDHLWRTIQRFDFYIGSTNAKAAFLIAFNSALLGGGLLKWRDITSPLEQNSWPAWIAGFALVLLATGCLVSTWLTFRVVNPFLSSPKHPGIYHSTVFFGHVAEHDSPENFITCLNQSNAESRTEDLAHQAHALAVGLNGKFSNLRKAIAWIMAVEIPALLILTGAIVAAVIHHLPHHP